MGDMTLVFVTGWLATRLVLLFYDGRLPTPALAILATVQFCWTLMAIGPSLVTLGFAAALVALLVLEERALPASWLNETRLVTSIIVLSTLFLARRYWGSTATEGVWAIGHFASDATLWFTFGLLIAANEANLVIRSLFHGFDLEPRTGAGKDAAVDKREYNAGRVIGILERWLMYVVLVASQNYSVVAIIIAAKGVARFRELDDREFAEYVLIGTLASTLLTIAIAESVILLGHLPV